MAHGVYYSGLSGRCEDVGPFPANISVRSFEAIHPVQPVTYLSRLLSCASTLADMIIIIVPMLLTRYVVLL